MYLEGGSIGKVLDQEPYSTARRLQRIISQSTRLPTVFLEAPAAPKSLGEHLLVDLKQENGCYFVPHSSLSSFSDTISEYYPEHIRAIKEIFEKILSTEWYFSPLLFRAARSSYFFRWHELSFLSQLIAHRRTNPEVSSVVQVSFGNAAHFEYAIVEMNTSSRPLNLCVGPALLRDEDLEYSMRSRMEFSDILTNLDERWIKLVDSYRDRRAGDHIFVYSSNYMSPLFLKASTYPFISPRDLVKILSRLNQRSDLFCRRQTEQEFTQHLEKTELTAVSAARRTRVPLSQRLRKTREHHLLESFLFLRNWLSSRFQLFNLEYEGEFRWPSSHERDNFRLCRFLSQLFCSIECTMYIAQPPKSSDLASLSSFASFIARDGSEERSLIMRQHIQEIADTQERSNSLAYRSFDANRMEFVDDRHGQRGISANKIGLSWPATSEFENWGRYGVACPLRIHGIPWGVVELVDDCSDIVRPEIMDWIGEAASMLSPFLFLEVALKSMEQLSKYGAQTSGYPAVDKSQVAGICSKLFLAEHFSLLFVDTEATQSDNVEVLLSWGEGLFSSGEKMDDERENEFFIDVMGTQEVRLLSVGKEEFHSIFSMRFGRTKHRFGQQALFVKVPRASTGDHSYAIVVLIYRQHITIEAQWVEHVRRFSQQIVTLIDGIFSDRNWEEKLRDRISHELRRSVRTIEQSVGKIDEFTEGLRKSAESLGSRYNRARSDITRLGTYIGDIERGASTVGRFAEILGRKLTGADRVDHPVIFIWKRKIQTEKRTSVDLHRTYFDSFMSKSRSLSGRGIKIDVWENQNLPQVRAHPELLSDVFASLADNVEKYAADFYSLRVQGEYSMFGSFNLIISNVGPALTDEDEARVMEEGYRGEIARTYWPDSGRGLGLFYARQLMVLEEFDIEYRFGEKLAKRSRDGYELMWHRFYLSFPRKFLVDPP